MAHEIETMAFVNEAPWHGLGNRLTPKQPIEIWQREAGMNWRINETEVLYSVSGGDGVHLKANPDNKVLFRSDTLVPLSVVSKRYKVVQPAEVLEFYRDLVSAGGFELETAGVLKGGKKLWALAKTGQETVLPGSDTVKGFAGTAGILWTNMAMDEETGRFDVQLLADVFTDLDQRTATVAAGAGLRFVTMLKAGQFRRQGITAGAFVLTWHGGRLLLFQFGDDGGTIFVAGLEKQVALFGRQGFALAAKADTFMVRQFEGEFLDL